MTAPGGQTKNDTTSRTPWYNQTFIAAIAAVISLVSLGLSAYFASRANGVAGQQALNGEQQELVTLITDIAQEPATMAQETTSLQHNQSALDNAKVGTQLTELAEAEEANYLLGVLPGSSLTAIDYDSSDAKAAANDIGRAFLAFRAPGVSQVLREYNQAYTDFFDAQYQARLDCRKAHDEVTDGKNELALIAQYPDQDTTALVYEEALDGGVTNLPPATVAGPGPCKASEAPVP